MKQILILALLLVVLVSQARGQRHWTRLNAPTSYNTALTPYFLDKNVGFIFYSGFRFEVLGKPFLNNMSTYLERTTDGGSTWLSIPYFDSIGCLITQMCFVSPQRGYASTISQSGPWSPGVSGVYETVDQGLHWKKISVGGAWFSSVYATSSAIFATKITRWADWSGPFSGRTYVFGTILISHDTGTTWDSISAPEQDPEYTTGFQRVYGNRDSLVASAYKDTLGKEYLIYSTDLGTTWRTSLLDSATLLNSMSLYVFPHTCNIIHEHVDTQNFFDDNYSFFEAAPPFLKWTTAIPHLETGAWLAGNKCAVYISYSGQDTNHAPLQRSTDFGSSWSSDGPRVSQGITPTFSEIDDVDWQNLSVVGYGSVVYAAACGVGDSLWKTTDGGDGTLSAAALAPKLALAHVPFPSGNDTLNLSSCEASQVVVTNFNIGCSWATFDSVTIAGLDPSEYSVTSTHYCGCTHVPDTSFIRLALTQSGIRNVTVHFHYTDDEFNQIDTTMPVVLDVKSGATAVPMSLTLATRTLTAHAGDTIEIPVYLTSDSTITFADTVSMMLPFALDTNALKALEFLPAFGGNPVDSFEYSSGRGASSAMLTVPLQIGNLTVSGRTLIGTLRCVVYLADTMQTNVSLQGASINASTGGCVALSTNLGGVNIVLTGCGDSTLLTFMKTGVMPLKIESIVPNPAGASLRVQGVGYRAQRFTLQLFDDLGNCVLTQEDVRSTSLRSDYTLHPIPFTLSLDVSSLPSGIYFLRVSSGGYAVSGSVAIER